MLVPRSVILTNSQMDALLEVEPAPISVQKSSILLSALLKENAQSQQTIEDQMDYILEIQQEKLTMSNKIKLLYLLVIIETVTVVSATIYYIWS